MFLIFTFIIDCTEDSVNGRLLHKIRSKSEPSDVTIFANPVWKSIRKGVREDTISLKHINECLETVFRDLKCKSGVDIVGKCLTLRGFADDIVRLAKSTSKVPVPIKQEEPQGLTIKSKNSDSKWTRQQSRACNPRREGARSYVWKVKLWKNSKTSGISAKQSTCAMKWAVSWGRGPKQSGRPTTQSKTCWEKRNKQVERISYTLHSLLYA